MTDLRILVTGGRGRLGSALGAQGCIALGRDQLDVCEPESIAAAFEAHQPQVVINAAAYTAVDKAESDPEAAYAVNGDAVCFLVDECEHRNIPLIQISTDCVFGDRRPDAPVSEMEEPDPLSVYGFSKRLGEWHAVRPGNVIVRVAWLFDEGAETFIGKILKIAESRDNLQLVNDEWGRPSFVGDLAPPLIELAGRLAEGEEMPQILHLGPPNPVNRLRWAEEIFATSRDLGGPFPELAPVSADAFPTPARRPRGLVLDTSLAEELLDPIPDWRGPSARAVRALLARA